MACSSGRVLADLISNRIPEVPHKDLAGERYRDEWRFQAA
jgi:D-amino-acid dehydrogenase